LHTNVLTAFDFCILRLFKLKTEAQTITENLTVKLQNSNQNSHLSWFSLIGSEQPSPGALLLGLACEQAHVGAQACPSVRGVTEIMKSSGEAVRRGRLFPPDRLVLCRSCARLKGEPACRLQGHLSFQTIFSFIIQLKEVHLHTKIMQ